MILLMIAGATPSLACDPPTNEAPGDGGPGTAETASATATDDADRIPCAPRSVLEGVCQRCHTSPLLRGAPFPLVTRSNVLATLPSGEVRALMIEQLEARRMPLAPETIGEDERRALLDWLVEGAPAVAPTTCRDE